ncbi:MAG: hypothetical protein ABSG45_01260 [Nitrososphaerales archaeon]
MNLRKIFAITIALSKSQLRASRTSGVTASFFRRPSILLILDLVAFAICTGLGYAAITLIQSLNAPGASQANVQLYSSAVSALKEALVFIPVFVPGMVLIAGLLFELNVSSKFSASDTVNWLPITQTEYVVASSLSVAYNYSISVAIVLGLTLFPSFGLGLGWLWTGMALTSVFTLFTGGTLVEILRATINRVSSLVMKRARRGALFFRLGLMAAVILVFETVFNPTLLIVVINGLSGTFSIFTFIPIFWGAVAVQAITTGDTLRVLLFSAGTVGFTGGLVWVATKVRSRYWSPVAISVSVTSAEYAPRSSSLVRLGLTNAEAAIVKKDLKGITRRRELSSILIIPVIFTAIFLFEGLTSSQTGLQSSGEGFLQDFPIFMVASIFSLLISSTSFGQESKSVMVLYSLPVRPEEILKAKAFMALLFSLAATLAILAIFSAIGGSDPLTLGENLAIAISIAVENVFIGLAFGARFPDFQERPRPRFMDPIWLLVMTMVGLVTALVTAVPVLLRDVASTAPGLTVPLYLFPAAALLAAVVSLLAYRWAKRSVQNLMVEYRI